MEYNFKNCELLCFIPITYYSIQKLLYKEGIETVIFNTDNPEERGKASEGSISKATASPGSFLEDPVLIWLPHTLSLH